MDKIDMQFMELMATDEEKQELVSARDQIVQFERQIEKIKLAQDKLRAFLLESMDKFGIKKIENDDITITRIADTDVEYFNKKKFREENPDLYDKYVSIRPKKGYISMRLKK